VTHFAFEFARPEDPADCIPEPLARWGRASLWTAYLTFGDLYLADVNDDPELEDVHEKGLDLWPASVRGVFEVLRGWFGGTGVDITLTARSGLPGLVDALTGRTAADAWAVQAAPRFEEEFVHSLATYGWRPAIWTALPAGEAARVSGGFLTTADLERLVESGGVSWWLSHGYKEPFVAGYTPSLAVADVAAMIGRARDVPVRVTGDPFVPHRVRLHRGGLA
jgi:hypothetical protein